MTPRPSRAQVWPGDGLLVEQGASVLTPADTACSALRLPFPGCARPLGLTCGVGDPAWRGGGTGGTAKVFVRGEVWSLSLGVTLRVRKLILGYGQTMPSCLAGRAGIVLLLSLICGRCLLMGHPLIERPCLWVAGFQPWNRTGSCAGGLVCNLESDTIYIRIKQPYS